MSKNNRDINIHIEPERIHIGIFFDVNEPILEKDFLNLLKDKGFKLIYEMELKPETTGVGILIGVPTVARKRGVCVDYIKEEGKIIIVGSKFDDVFLTFKEIREILEKNEILQEAKRFEIFTQVKAKVGKKPISAIKLISKSVSQIIPRDRLSKLEKILGDELIPMCIRFCPKRKKDAVENIKENNYWIDLYVLPYILNTRYLSIWLVYRDKNVTKIENFAKDLRKRLEDIIKVIIK